MTADVIATDGNTRKIYPIPGGVHPAPNKQQSNTAPLTDAPLPARVYLPLNQHLGAPAKPVVSVGEQVLTGQLIAEATGPVSANIHASISGTVSAIEEHPLPHPSAMAGTCVVIESDGRDQWVELTENPDFLSLPSEQLLEIIRAAGIVGLGGAGFPTATKLSVNSQAAATPSKPAIEHLLINGTECEPYITADDLLMRSHPEAIIQGALAMAKALGNPADVVIGMEDNKPEALAALQAAARGTGIDVVAFPCQYPSGGEKQLIQRLTGKEVPSGALPASVGCVVQNVGTAYALYRALRFGEPLVSRVTTVVGEALAHSGNVTVRLGTPVADLLAHFGQKPKKTSRLIMGGPMMGFALTDTRVPVVKTTNCLIAASFQEMPPSPTAQACIRCGLCAEACPAGLLPQQLYWYARADDHEKLQAYNLFDCIECGACAYTCPSHIPLVQYYRSAKGHIRQAREDKIKSDHSRQRFEFRQQRLAQQEAEKEAKRRARAEAAEKAKQKLADKPTASAPAAPAPAAPANSADQVAKLERALASAQSRLANAEQQLAEAQAENSERTEQLQAKVNQAQVRVSDAESKLAAARASTEATPAAPADDPIAAAIARAQAKQSMTPEQKAKANVETLTTRLAKAREKLAAAQAEGSDKVTALQTGVDKLQEKLASAKQELAELGPSQDSQEPAPVPADDPAQAAIERAKAKAAATASMSEREKLEQQLQSLRTRLAKAQQKLSDAKAEGSDKQDALALGVSKLEDKLAQTEQALGQLSD